MKTTIFAIAFIWIILLVTQPSNCLDPYHDLEAYIFGSYAEETLPASPSAVPTLFSGEEYETQHSGALPTLPFGTISTFPDAFEYSFYQNLPDSAPLPLYENLDMQLHNNFATQQPPITAVTESSLILNTSRKWPRQNATHLCDRPGCTRIYPSKSSLEIHIRLVHNKERPHLCDRPGCTKAYGNSGNLQTHIRAIHNKERPYQCDRPGCTQTYTQKSHLNSHIRTFHNKERPYKCGHPGCATTFTKRCNLNAHIRAIHKHFVCNVTGCNQSFHNNAILASHMANLHRNASEQAPAASTDLNDHADESNLQRSKK